MRGVYNFGRNRGKVFGDFDKSKSNLVKSPDLESGIGIQTMAFEGVIRAVKS
jgi:hypothetical protein